MSKEFSIRRAIAAQIAERAQEEIVVVCKMPTIKRSSYKKLILN